MAEYRCSFSGHPCGTDTRMVGAPPCECQGCRATAEITQLRASLAAAEAERDANFAVAQQFEMELRTAEARAVKAEGELESVRQAHWELAQQFDVEQQQFEAVCAERDAALRKLAWMTSRPHASDLELLGRTTPSGRTLWQCRICGRETAGAERICDTIGMRAAAAAAKEASDARD